MTDFTKPTAVADADVAYPTRVAEMMPKYEEIPAEFRTHRSNKWVQMQQDWFFRGLTNAKWTPKPGIDQRAALRHLAVIQGSWEPKHEHKEAAVAYLASLWFDDVTYEKASAVSR
jgi:hypothetical protein